MLCLDIFKQLLYTKSDNGNKCIGKGVTGDNARRLKIFAQNRFKYLEHFNKIMLKFYMLDHIVKNAAYLVA